MSSRPALPASFAMIQLSGLTKRFGDRVLLDDVTWQVTDGDRVGLAGPNGAGKTTLLKMLAGLDEPDSGNIIRPSGLTVGYLPQDGLEHSGRSLSDEASLAFRPLLEARAEIERIEHALADPALPDGEHETLLVRYHDLTEFFRREEGHSASTCASPRCSRVWVSPKRISTNPPRRSPAAGRCASRWPNCCSAGRRCCCSTNRRTISISTRATGSRNTCRPIRTPSSWSRTIGSSSTRS